VSNHQRKLGNADDDLNSDDNKLDLVKTPFPDINNFGKGNSLEVVGKAREHCHQSKLAS